MTWQPKTYQPYHNKSLVKLFVHIVHKKAKHVKTSLQEGGNKKPLHIHAAVTTRPHPASLSDEQEHSDDIHIVRIINSSSITFQTFSRKSHHGKDDSSGEAADHRRRVPEGGPARRRRAAATAVAPGVEVAGVDYPRAALLRLRAAAAAAVAAAVAVPVSRPHRRRHPLAAVVTCRCTRQSSLTTEFQAS